jgi:hypothetical protein
MIIGPPPKFHGTRDILDRQPAPSETSSLRHEGKNFAAALGIRKVVVESLDREGESRPRLLNDVVTSARARTTALHIPVAVDAASWVGRFPHLP